MVFSKPPAMGPLNPISSYNESFSIMQKGRSTTRERKRISLSTSRWMLSQGKNAKDLIFNNSFDEMASPWKLSGMQRQVLALYRCFLRAARLKNLEDRQRIVSIVSAEFHHNANNVDRKNFQYIEYLLRRGKRQLEQLKNSTTISLSTINLNSSAASKTITEDKKIASTYH